MKFKLQLVAACAAALALGSVQAQEAIAGTGLYIGGSIGQAKWHGDSDENLPGLDSTRTGGKVYAGYEFSPYFALELGYAEFGKFQGDLNTSVKANGPFLDAVGKFPFAPGWAALVRGGVFQGKLDLDTPLGSRDDNATAAKFGVGLQYDLSHNTSIRTEYERYRFDALDVKPDVDLFSVGVNYRF